MNRSVNQLAAVLLFSIVLSCQKAPNNMDSMDNVSISYSFVDPRDGEEYGVIELGDQVWMDRNLNFSPTEGNSGYYANDSSEAHTYGRLYSWDTALESVPDGWHLPSLEEWQTLIDHCGGDSIAGGKLKSEGEDFWLFPNLGASNEFDFGAVGTGHIDFSGSQGFMEKTFFWTSTPINTVSELAYANKLTQLSKTIVVEEKLKGILCSVRCIRD